jgi:hypothetical protein
MASVLFRNTLPAALALTLFFTVIAGFSQRAVGQDLVQVREIRFTNQNAPSGDRWYRTEINIQANSNPSGDAAPNSRWVDNIEVTLTMAFPVEAHGSKYTFYRASATLVSLEQRKNASVYFYLPWEILDRDRLGTRDPEFYAVQIRVDGQDVPLNASHVSRNIGDATVLQNFLNAAAEGVVRTEGVLVPTYLSPFMGMEGRRGSPSYIRREPQ